MINRKTAGESGKQPQRRDRLMKKLMLVLTLVLAVMLCTGAAVAENTEILGQPFPDFTAKDTEGNEFTLSEALKDHEAVLINIWATWCPPCRNEFPDLNEVYLEYRDRVAFIALSSEGNDTDSVIEGFRKDWAFPFPWDGKEKQD
jgi:Thiol-disulfide isomerase and thioredoxins